MNSEQIKEVRQVVVFIAVLALMVWLLMGCCPCRHLTASMQDSVRVEVVERIVEVPDTFYYTLPNLSERVTTSEEYSHLENEYALSDAAILADGSLSHTLEVRPRPIKVAFKRPTIHRDSVVYHNSYRTVTVEVERALTWWQQTQIRGFWAMLILVAVLAAVWRVKRKFF